MGQETRTRKRALCARARFKTSCSGMYADLSDEFIELAVQGFFTLRTRDSHKIPATSELLAWLQVLAHRLGTDETRCASGCRIRGT